MNEVDKFWSQVTVPFDDFKSIEESLKFEDWRCSIYPKYKELMDYYKSHNGQTILDYGCGVANDLIRFANISKPEKIYGVDISEKALEQATKRINLHKYNNIELIKLPSDEVWKLPIKDHSVDYIHSGGVLHHTTNIPKRLREFKRILKNGGTGNIMVYNRHSLWFHLYLSYHLMVVAKTLSGDADLNFKETTDGGGCPISHCYRPEEFISLCQDAGLECEYMGGYLSDMEINFYKTISNEAINSNEIRSESKEFLKAITLDKDGLPMYNGKYCGIGGSYRISKKSVSEKAGVDCNLYSLALEVTNICNIKCKMCLKQNEWYKNYYKSAPKVMPLEKFKKIVDEYVKLPVKYNWKSLILQFQGESLTLENFFDYCTYVNESGIPFGFTTNGTLLTKEMTDKLLGLNKFNSIAFSIDSVNKEMFESIRIGAKYDTVFENINYFIEQQAKRRTANGIGVSINMVVMPENESEIDSVVKYFTGKGVVNLTASNRCDENTMPIKVNFDGERKRCLSPFTYMVVLTDGKAVTCCRDNQYKLNLGNVFNDGLESVWNGQRLENLRKIQILKKWDVISPCNNCMTWACGNVPEKYIGVSHGLQKYEGCFWYGFRK